MAPLTVKLKAGSAFNVCCVKTIKFQTIQWLKQITGQDVPSFNHTADSCWQLFHTFKTNLQILSEKYKVVLPIIKFELNHKDQINCNLLQCESNWSHLTSSNTLLCSSAQGSTGLCQKILTVTTRLTSQMWAACSPGAVNTPQTHCQT